MKYMNGWSPSENLTGRDYEEGRSRAGAVKVIDFKTCVVKEKYWDGGDGSDSQVRQKQATDR